MIFNKPEDVKPDFHYAKIDDKVIVWNNYDNNRYRGHFAGISEQGKPMAFSNGRSLWTEIGKDEYDNCKRVF